MKTKAIILLFNIWSTTLNAQFEPIPITKINVNSILTNGGYTLGIDELFISLTDVWQDKKYKVYKISGYVQNAYNRETNSDTFDIAIYDSATAKKLSNNMFDYQEKILPINRLRSEKHEMFTIYLREDEVAEIEARFVAYPVRISILK